MAGQEDDFAEIIRLLKQISEKLDKPCSCGPKDSTQAFPPPNPIVGTSCPVCKLSSPNNYACARQDCPTAIRASFHADPITFTPQVVPFHVVSNTEVSS